MNRLIKKLFENRGYTSDYLSGIDIPTRDLLMDIDVLCAKLKQIHDSGDKIVILPDFDMDGISSGTLGFAGLAELGFNVSLFIPSTKDGYGFSAKTINELIANYPDVKAIITCDVGISCYAGISAAKHAGIDVLVTDHHKQSQKSDADIIVDPMRIDETYEFPYICGACVLYKCLVHYSELYCDNYMQEQISRLCVFAGIGTISDSMPLLYENRQLVRDSISIMRLLYSYDDFIVNNITGCDIYRRAFRGLYNVLSVFSENDKLSSSDSITEEFIGFYMAPVFNSIKRMKDDVAHAFDVFFGSNSLSSMNYLVELNERRKEDVIKYMADIETMKQPYAPYIYFSDAPEGILGLLAQKIVVTSMPAVVLRYDEDKLNKLHGSVRSPFWYPFLDKALSQSVYAGGHNPACGVGFRDVKQLKDFYNFLVKDTAADYDKLDKSLLEFKPDFVISNTAGDGDTGIDILLFAEYLEELEKYHPFGSSFEKPNVLLKFHSSDGVWSLLGKEKNHIKIRLPYGFEVILWNQSEFFNMKDSNSEIRIIGNLNINKFNGSHTINFIGNIDC